MAGRVARSTLWLLGLASLGIACKAEPSLITLNVKSDDGSFDGVNLRLVANGTVSKDFPGASFSTSVVYRLGFYLPGDMTGTVTIMADAEEGGCVRGRGFAEVPGVAAGVTTIPIDLEVMRTDICPPFPDAGAGSGGAGVPGTGGAGIPGTGGTTVIGSGGVGVPGTGGTIVIGSGGVGVPGTGGTIVAGSGGRTGSACGALIDDMEAGNGRICPGNGRVGHWFTYRDTATVQTPDSGQVPALPADVNPPRAGSSRRAMHTFGTVSQYAGMGCLLNNEVIGAMPMSFDASSYSGIRFYAKGTTPTLRVIVQMASTVSTMFNGTCTATTCEGNATTVSIGGDWTLVSVSFSALLGGTVAFRPSELWTIELAPNAIGSFDFWIDDLTFY